MKKTKLNYLVDLAFFVQFVLVGYSGLIMYFNRHSAGPILRLIHDKVGILMLLFFVVHIALHWKWILLTTKSCFRKVKQSKKTRKVKLNYFVDLALFIQFALVGYSGFIMYFNHHAAGQILRLIHDKIGILMLFFFVAHIALHWRWIVFTTKNLFGRQREMKEGEIIEANYMPVD
ncbi:DUF4405 domain-containing protein [Methanosarcina barkeri]|uniref:Flavinylation-associated cytochrome domain-containing protein n=1 Tax=Methanosarcina barkeri (strain Fusaro / DSM 804) TaxID=269797 RepID=Q467N4_METBF|nr:DUF4405 domain-containing protein [Methanosarcina barkeri]